MRRKYYTVSYGISFLINNMFCIQVAVPFKQALPRTHFTALISSGLSSSISDRVFMPSPGSGTVFCKTWSRDLPLGSPGNYRSPLIWVRVSGVCLYVCIFHKLERIGVGSSWLWNPTAWLPRPKKAFVGRVWVCTHGGARVTGREGGNVIQLCIELCAKQHICYLRAETLSYISIPTDLINTLRYVVGQTLFIEEVIDWLTDWLNRMITLVVELQTDPNGIILQAVGQAAGCPGLRWWWLRPGWSWGVVEKVDRERLGKAIAPGLDDQGARRTGRNQRWVSIVLTWTTGWLWVSFRACGCHLIASKAHGNDVGITWVTTEDTD